MGNLVIYYQKKECENTDHAVQYVNELIDKLEKHHSVKGVFLDEYDSKSELIELFNSSLSLIDYVYIEESFNDNFDNDLINQLAKAENFKIKYFHQA